MRETYAAGLISRLAAAAVILSCPVVLPSPQAVAAADSTYACSFAPGAWDSNDWILVKSARWDHFGGWLQREDHIENETPAGASTNELRSSRNHETYSSMVLKQTFKGKVGISATMSYDDRMAPLIVIAPELGKDSKGRPEYREHWEIVLFDEGINVWHHMPKDGKPWWIKAAYARFPTHPKTNYKLTVRIKKTKKGKIMSVFLDDEEKLGYHDNSLPDTCHVGITACEGVNRFYRFEAGR